MIQKNEFPRKLAGVAPESIRRIIELAVYEDLDGVGDITSNSLLASERNKTIAGAIYAKEEGVICGTEVVKQVYSIVCSSFEIGVETLIGDGGEVKKGDTVVKLRGSAQAILTGERIALNFIGHLSGIATKVHRYTKLIEGTKTKLLDTRKTIPGLRELQKYAVSVGGGYNHRIGLYDMILIKDNHIRAVGSVKEACVKARKEYPYIVIEAEVQDAAQLEDALTSDCDIIMLDNMNNDEVRESLKRIDGKKMVEVSGNVDEKRLVELAEIGVDFVSMGALTHTVKPLDLSLELDS